MNAVAKTVMALAMLAAAAWAQEGSAEKPGLLKSDANGDGAVSFEELKAARPKATREAFDRLDTNKDGVLSRADKGAKAAAPKKKAPKEDTAAKLKRADKDGVRTPADAPKKPAGETDRHRMVKRLRAADADGDGKATFEEVEKAKPGFPRADFDRFDADKDGALTEADAQAGRPKGDGLARKLRGADKDGDKRVSLEEAKAAAPGITPEAFGRLDRNGDGYISPEDRPKPAGQG